jgi:Holliday junction resolvasome RuvABC endonuclease subunit
MDNLPWVVLGIDPAATHIAAVSLLGDKFRVTVRKNLGKSGPEACFHARELMLDTIDRTREWAEQQMCTKVSVFACYELPVLGRGGFRSTIVQCFTSGAVQATFYERNCAWQSVNVSSWKKAVVGKGNADKRQVAEHIRLRWPALYAEANGNQDVYDASAIALYGRQLLQQGVAQTRAV